jgi:hypothetical protein
VADPRLIVPDSGDIAQPEVSIVVPALDEELTIGEFVDWCRAGLERAGVAGEILIVDSSSDRTAEIALARGARVVKTPRRGLGRAYIDALPFVRGDYLLLGDCDCTYDFREIGPFVEKFREGYEFIMGSRSRGYIEPGAIPPLHRYFGTPLTTWILNFIYSTRFSDIHCGMRGITRTALREMRLGSQSWEYASEMVLKSVRLKLRTTEVPIRFFKDKQGRLSHHRRAGWLSPWRAGWLNLRAMFVHGADFFLLKPGLALVAMGLALVAPLTFGPVDLGPLRLSLYWMLVGLSLTILGVQCSYMGILAQTLYDPGRETARRWTERFAYDRTVLASAVGFLAGIGLCATLVREYVRSGLALPSPPPLSCYLAVTGLTLMMASFLTFTFTLVLHASAMTERRSP